MSKNKHPHKDLKRLSQGIRLLKLEMSTGIIDNRKNMRGIIGLGQVGFTLDGKQVIVFLS